MGATSPARPGLRATGAPSPPPRRRKPTGPGTDRPTDGRDTSRRWDGWSAPVEVPADLTALTGPTTGRVRLPVRVYSSGPEHDFDLADAADLQALYEIVLTEGTAADICRYLLAELLRLQRSSRNEPANALREAEPGWRACARKPPDPGATDAHGQPIGSAAGRCRHPTHYRPRC